MTKYSGKQVAFTIMGVIIILLLFSLELLWFQSMEIDKERVKKCEPVNYTSNDYIPKSYCSNTFQDVWLCNMRQTSEGTK